MTEGGALLTVLVPQQVMAECFPKFPRIKLETPNSEIGVEIRANGRPTLVPAGIVYLTASAKGGRPVTVTLELRGGQSHTYRFTDRQLLPIAPKRLAIARIGTALPGTSGAFFVRFLQGPDQRPVGMSHVVTQAPDGGLSVTFAGRPAIPLVAEVLVPGRSRVLLSMATTQGPGVGYATARLDVDRHSGTATISSDFTDPELRAARQFTNVGNTVEAMALIKPYLDRFERGSSHDDVEAASVAYILIRSGQSESLFPWSRKLLRSGDLTADGLIIAAEWFGQAGCHLTALNFLRQMVETGRPLFTDGYSLALARLATYGAATIRPGSSAKSRRATDRESSFSGKADDVWTSNKWEEVARSMGQELREWDRLQAGMAHERLTRGIAEIDWSSYFLRMTPSRRKSLPRLLRAGVEWLDTRTASDWIRIAWRLGDHLQSKSEGG